ncbi:MAG: hypothetical protein Q8K37_08080, partial [Alphaproteobacteria bacterium]|nr:hypothetical protein [Alphaproteobacteria bacterium]
IDKILPEVYLTINTQQLDNRGHVFGGSLDITTSRNGYDKDQKVADCSIGLGQIKALHDLILKGEMFNNAALLDAETMTLTYQKILNEEKGVIAAKDITIETDHLDNHNRIEAQNLLDITARKSAFNRKKSCLKSGGNILIKAAVLNNKNIIQAKTELSIQENMLVINKGKLISQGEIDGAGIKQIAAISPEIYLTIVTQQLDNKGYITGGSLDITTNKNGQGANKHKVDCSNKVGQIKASYDLTLKGAIFHNAASFEAKKIILTHQKIVNQKRGRFIADDHMTIKASILNNKDVIQSGGQLSIEDNVLVTNSGKMISQGILVDGVISAIPTVLKDVYLKIVTQKLKNSGFIFAGNLDIDTKTSAYDANAEEADFSSKFGQIETLLDLKLAGHVFHNAALLEAQKLTLEYKKIKNTHLIRGKANLDITANVQLDNLEKGILTSDNAAIIKTAIFKNLNLVEAGHDLTIQECGLLDNKGEIIGQKNVDLKLYNASILEKLYVLTDIQATEVNNHGGVIKGFVLKIKGEQLDNLNGKIFGFGLLDINASLKVQNKENSIIRAEHNLAVKSDLIENKAAFQGHLINFDVKNLQNHDKIVAKDSFTVKNANLLENHAPIQARSINLESKKLYNHALIQSNEDLTIESDDLIENHDYILSQGILVNNEIRKIESFNNECPITLSKGKLYNKGHIFGGKFIFKGLEVDNQNGALEGLGRLEITAPVKINNIAKKGLKSDVALILRTKILNNESQILGRSIEISAPELTKMALTNMHLIQAAENLDIQGCGELINNGKIEGQRIYRDLVVAAEELKKPIHLTSIKAEKVTHVKGIVTGSIVKIEAPHIDHQTGFMQAKYHLDMIASTRFANKSLEGIKSGHSLKLNAGTFENRGPVKAIDITFEGQSIENHHQINATKKVTLTAHDHIHNFGGIKSELPKDYVPVKNEEIALLTLNACNMLNKGIVAGRKLKIDAQTIDNDAGSINAQYDLNCIGHENIVNQNKGQFDSNQTLTFEGTSFNNYANVNAPDITLTFADVTNHIKESYIRATGSLVAHIANNLTNNGSLYGNKNATFHLKTANFNNNYLLFTPDLNFKGGVVTNANNAEIKGINVIKVEAVSTFVNNGIVKTDGTFSGSIAHLNNTHKISAKNINFTNTNLTQKGNLEAIGEMDLSGSYLDNENVIKAANLTISYDDITSRAGEMNGSSELNFTARRSFIDETKADKKTILKSNDIITLTMPKTDIGFWGSIMGRSIVWNNGKKLTLSNFVAGNTSLTFNEIDEIEVQESATISSNDLKINNVKTNIYGNLKGEKAYIQGSKVDFGEKSVISSDELNVYDATTTILGKRIGKNTYFKGVITNFGDKSEIETENLTILSDEIYIKGKHKYLGNVKLTGKFVFLADILPVKKLAINDIENLAKTVDLALNTQLISETDIIINADYITQNGLITADKEKNSQTTLTGVMQTIKGKIKSTNLTLTGDTANINGTIESALSIYNHEIVKINANAKLEKGTHRFAKNVKTLNLSGAIACKLLEIPESTNVLFNKDSSISILHDFNHIRPYPLTIGTNITSIGNIDIKTPGLLHKTGVFASSGDIYLKGSYVEDLGETYAVDPVAKTPKGVVTYNSPQFPLLPTKENALLAREVIIISEGDANITTPIQTANLSLNVPGNISVNAALNHDVLNLTSKGGSITINGALHSNSGLTLNATKGILIKAALTAKGDINCVSKGFIQSNKFLKSEGNISFKSIDGAISLYGMNASKNIDIEAKGLVSVNEPIDAGANLTIISATDTIGLNGALTASGDITLNVNNDLYVNRNIMGDNITLISNKGDIYNNLGFSNAALYSLNKIKIFAKNFINNVGYIIANGGFDITTLENCTNQTGLIHAGGPSVFKIGGQFSNINLPGYSIKNHEHTDISLLYQNLNEDKRYKSYVLLMGETTFNCNGAFVNENSDFVSKHNFTGFINGNLVNNADALINFEGSVDLSGIVALENYGNLRFGAKVDEHNSRHENFVLSAANVNNHAKICALNGLTLNVSGTIRNLNKIYIIGDFIANTAILDNSVVGSIPGIDLGILYELTTFENLLLQGHTIYPFYNVFNTYGTQNAVEALKYYILNTNELLKFGRSFHGRKGRRYGGYNNSNPLEAMNNLNYIYYNGNAIAEQRFFSKTILPRIDVQGDFTVSGYLKNRGYSVTKYSIATTPIDFINKYNIKKYEDIAGANVGNDKDRFIWRESGEVLSFSEDKLDLRAEAPKISCKGIINTASLDNSYGMLHAGDLNRRTDNTIIETLYKNYSATYTIVRTEPHEDKGLRGLSETSSVSASTGPLNAGTMNVVGDDFYTGAHYNVSNLNVTATNFYHTQDAIKPYDITGLPPAGILALMCSAWVMNDFELAAPGKPYAYSSGLGEGALLHLGLSACARTLDVPEEKRQDYFMALFAKNPAMYFPDGSIDVNKVIQFQAARFYNLWGENITILIEKSKNKNLAIGNGEQEQNALLDLIASCIHNKNMAPIELTGENGEAFIGLPLGYCELISKLFAYFKENGLACDVNGQIIEPENHCSFQNDAAYDADYEGDWGQYAYSQYHGDEDDYDPWNAHADNNIRELGFYRKNQKPRKKREYRALGDAAFNQDQSPNALMAYQPPRKAQYPTIVEDAFYEEEATSYQPPRKAQYPTIDDEIVDADNIIDASHHRRRVAQRPQGQRQKPNMPVIFYQSSTEDYTRFIQKHGHSQAFQLIAPSPSIISGSNNRNIAPNVHNMRSNLHPGIATFFRAGDFNRFVNGLSVPCIIVTGDVYDLPQHVVPLAPSFEAPSSSRINAHIGKRVGLILGKNNNDASAEFTKLPDFEQLSLLLADIFDVPTYNAHIAQIAGKFADQIALLTKWGGLPYTGKLRADVLGILKAFGFSEEFDGTTILGDAVVIARVLEDTALRLTGNPYFHEDDRGKMAEKQVKELLINMIVFVRKHWSLIDFKKPFPESMRHLVTKPMLWLVEEDLSVGAIKLKLLMPYIIFPDTILAEIEQQLKAPYSLKTLNVKVSNAAVIGAPINVTESTNIECKDFISYMRRDYGSKILYNTSTKNGKQTIHDAHIVPTITFRDHEEMHFGEKFNVKASNNIVNDAGRIFANAMYFEAGGDMRNTGQMCFVDSLKANINGTFSNDIIVLTEYEEVNGVLGGRTFTGNAARNAIKAHSGQIIAIADHKGFRDLKKDKLLTKAEAENLMKANNGKRVKLHTYTGHEARHIIKKNPESILAMGDGKHFHDVKTGALLTKEKEVATKGKGLLDIKAGKDFNHRGIIDVNDVKIVANGNLNVENLPDQFIVKWDPGAKAKQGMDCFSIASAFTPSEIRARDGSVKLVVGGDAKIYASLLAAADDIIVEAQGFIKAESKGESYLGNVSIENGRRNRTVRQESDIIIQKVSLEAGGDVRLIARENVDIKGGTIAAALEVFVSGKNVTLTPIQIIAENKVKSYGSRGFSYYKNKTAYSTHDVQTTDIVANNIKLAAKHNVNIKASMLMAFEDIEITAGNDINIVEDLVHHYVHSKSFSAHLNFFGRKAMEHSIQKQYAAAGRALAREFGIFNQVEELLEDKYGEAKHGADYVAESIKTYSALCAQSDAIAKLGLGNYIKKEAVEKLLSSSLTLKFAEDHTQWTEAIVPLMKARMIIMKAGNNILLRGIQAEAQTMDLEGNNITIEAAQEHYDHKDKERTIGVHANAVFDPTEDDFGLNVGVSGGYASSSTHKVTQDNAHLNVGNFKAKAGDKFKMAGAVINTENADIEANQLLMESLLDTESG